MQECMCMIKYLIAWRSCTVGSPVFFPSRMDLQMFTWLKSGKKLVHVSNTVWPGIGASSPDHCSVLSRNMDVSVPQSSLDYTMHRVTFHLCVTSVKVLLCHCLLLFSSKLEEGIAQEQVSVLVAASITPQDVLFI